MGKEWLGAPLIKKRLRKVQKIEERNAREPCGVGSRGPLKGPDGVQAGGNKIIFSSGARFQLIDFLNVADLTFLNRVK